MAVEKLGGRVNHHVRAQRNGLLEIGRHESVVDDQFNFLLAANVADGPNVAQGHEWVGGRLDVNHARVSANGALDVPYVGGVHVGELHPVAGQNLVEQAGHAAIKIVPGDHVVSRSEHGAEALIAAMPLAKTRDATPPSSDARFSSRRVRVGFDTRAYS